MKVLDIFSWLPAEQISLKQLEQIFRASKIGNYHGEYHVAFEPVDIISADIMSCRNELAAEGKSVAYILKEKDIIAVVGYKE